MQIIMSKSLDSVSRRNAIKVLGGANHLKSLKCGLSHKAKALQIDGYSVLVRIIKRHSGDIYLHSVSGIRYSIGNFL